MAERWVFTPATGGALASNARMYPGTPSHLHAFEGGHHDLQNEDLKDRQELGKGNVGSAKRVEYALIHTAMAKKVRTGGFPSIAHASQSGRPAQVLLVDAKADVRKQTLGEL